MESFHLSILPEKLGNGSPKPIGCTSSDISSESVKENASPGLSASVHDRRFFQINNKENSNLIQVFSQVKSIWKGDKWSEVVFRVRLHSSVVSLNKERCTPLILAASIQREKTGQMYGNESDKSVQIEFGRTTNLLDKSYATVDSDPFYQVKIILHNTVFEPQETFVLRVDVDQIDGKREIDAFIFGCSQSIWVTKFSFAIEPDFMKNQHVVKTDDGYVWFGKCGTSNSGLDVDVSLKKEDGATVLSPNPIPFVAELLYDDFLPAPEFVLSSHKLRRNSTSENKTKKPMKPMKLFTQLTRNPAILPYENKASVTFRIEEVSFHHPGHTGFKVKVSALHDSQAIIHPAILRDLVVVLSKPKYESGFDKKEECTQSNKSLKKRNFGLMDTNQSNFPPLTIPRQVSTGETSNEAHVNLHNLADCFVRHGVCMCCKLEMQSSKDFYSTAAHKVTCHAVMNLLPRISWYSPACMAKLCSTADETFGSSIQAVAKALTATSTPN